MPRSRWFARRVDCPHCAPQNITVAGSFSLRPHLRRLPPEQRDAARAMLRRHAEFTDLPADVALYWADGTRTLAEILDLTELETQVRDPEGLVQYFELLARLELIELG